MSRSRTPRPLPIPPSTMSPYEPSSCNFGTTSLDPSRPSEINSVPFGSHNLPYISLGGKVPQPPDAGVSIPLSSIAVQMQTCTLDNKEPHNTGRPQDDTSLGYLRALPTHSELRYNATDTNQNRPRSRHPSFSATSSRTTPEPQEPRSQSTPASERTPRGAGLKSCSSTRGLQSRYTSRPKKSSRVKIVHNKDEEALPTSGLLWYRGPVHGALPGRTLRSHSMTKIRNKAWVIGGYDDRQTYHDIYCLDLEILQWSHPEYKGDIPPPCRGHTATAVDHRIFVIGGMPFNGTSEPITVYIFDTLALSWVKPSIAPGSEPVQRRAHSAVYWDEKIWIFGGGNGLAALNDVWSLDVSSVIEGRRTGHGQAERLSLRWERFEGQEMKTATEPRNWPNARGYHSADIVDGFMIIIGGADGQTVLDSVWVLNLETKEWYHVDWLKGSPIASRLAHSSTRLGPYLFLFGGVGKEYDSELHMLNLVTLQEEQRSVYGIPPTPRGYHTMVHGNGRIHVIGGANATHGFDDVWILELASLAYCPQVTDFKVEPLEDIGWY